MRGNYMKGKNIFVNDNKEYTFEEYTEATFENQTSIPSIFRIYFLLLNTFSNFTFLPL